MATAATVATNTTTRSTTTSPAMTPSTTTVPSMTVTTTPATTPSTTTAPSTTVTTAPSTTAPSTTATTTAATTVATTPSTTPETTRTTTAVASTATMTAGEAAASVLTTTTAKTTGRNGVSGSSSLSTLPSSNANGSSSLSTLPSSNANGSSSLSTLPSSNVNGSSSLSTLPSSNVNGSSFMSTLPSSNVNGSSSLSTLPSSNVNGSSSLSTLPSSNVNGSSPLSTLPSSNVNGSSDSTTDPESASSSGSSFDPFASFGSSSTADDDNGPGVQTTSTAATTQKVIPTTPTPTTPGRPLNPSDTSYASRADYHVPDMYQTGRLADGNSAPRLSSGPLGFGKAVDLNGNLNDGEKVCMKLGQVVKPQDKGCWQNPGFCKPGGISVSIWVRINFRRDDGTPRYIFSTGGDDSGMPGIAIYYISINLHALVSTASFVWTAEAPGPVLNSTWANVAIRWDDRKGLYLYVNGSQVAHAQQREDLSRTPKNALDPVEITVGCRRSGLAAYEHYAHGEFDEVAIFLRSLSESEVKFFMGGFEKKETCDPEKHPLRCATSTHTLLEFIDDVKLQDLAVFDQSVEFLKTIANAVTNSGSTQQLPSANGKPDKGKGNLGGIFPGFRSAFTTTASPVIQQKHFRDMSDLIKIAETVIQNTLNAEALPKSISAEELKTYYNFLDVISSLFAASERPVWKQIQLKESGSADIVYILNNWLMDRLKLTAMEASNDTVHLVQMSENIVVQADKTTLATFRLAHETSVTFPDYGGNQVWENVTELWRNPRDRVTVPSAMFGVRPEDTEVHLIQILYNTYHLFARLENSITGTDTSLVFLDSRVITFEVDPSYSSQVLEDAAVKVFLEHVQKRPTTGRKLLASDEMMAKGEILRRHCVRWDEFQTFKGKKFRGGWTTDGCSVYDQTTENTTCQCDRLGTYTVLALLRQPFVSPPDEEWLLVMKWLIYFLSALLLVFYVASIIMRQSLRDQFHLIRLNLALAAIGALVSFFSADFVKDDKESCRTLAGFVHFFYMAVSVWLALLSHALFAGMVNGVVGGRVMCYIPIGWGIPIVLIGLSVGTNPNYGYDPKCLIGPSNGMRMLLIGPVIFFGLISFFFSIIVVCNMRTPAIKRESVVSELRYSTRWTIVVTILFVCTWVFGFLTFIDFRVEYEFPNFNPLFQVLNASLGIFIVLMLGFGSIHYRKTVWSNDTSYPLKKNKVESVSSFKKERIRSS